MRIITWNCQMAFRKKTDYILDLNPDILVVPESERPDKIDFEKHKTRPIQKIWIGENKNKGLGIYSYNKLFDIEPYESYTEEFKYVMPIRVTYDKSLSFLLFAVWTKNTTDFFSSYIVQAYRAVKHYKNVLDHNSILVGDFNSNTIWDEENKRKEATHSDFVKLLKTQNINSLYHTFHAAEHGKEKHASLYMYRDREKGYHIDYVFAGASWEKRLENIWLGEFEDWCMHSDHVPLVADFMNPT